MAETFSFFKKEGTVESELEKKTKEEALAPTTKEELFAYYEKRGIDKQKLLEEEARYGEEYNKSTHYPVCFAVIKDHFFRLYVLQEKPKTPSKT